MTSPPLFSQVLGVLVVVVATIGLLPVGASPATAGETVSTRLVRMAHQLEVAPQRARGYDREKFVHWTDTDADGCDTRDEVLLEEAVEDPDVSGSCDLDAGEWFSYYDGVEVTDASDLDIDHLVPLAEAWRSGARRWTKATRQRFANDLGDRRSLVAVTASSNRSKSDRDPDEWLPRTKAHCRYVREWVAVKTRWQLRVERREKRAVLGVVDGCRNVEVRVRTARVVRR